MGMKLEQPRAFLGVLTTANLIAFVVYVFVGGYGASVYGDCLQDVIYENFPADSLEVASVQIVLCFVLFLTYGLQMHPVYSFVEAQLMARALYQNAENASGGEAVEMKTICSDDADVAGPSAVDAQIGECHKESKNWRRL